MKNIIESIANQYYEIIKNTRNEKSKWTIFVVVLYLLSVCFVVSGYISIKKNSTLCIILFSILSIISVIFMLYFENKRRDEIFSIKINRNSKQLQLLSLKKILRKCDLIKITDQTKTYELIEYVDKTYKSKFITINKIRKAFNTICAILIIPLALTITDNILNSKLDFEDKVIVLVCIFIILLVSFIVVSSIIDFFEEISELKNYKYKALLEDLKIISKFDLKWKLKIHKE